MEWRYSLRLWEWLESRARRLQHHEHEGQRRRDLVHRSPSRRTGHGRGGHSPSPTRAGIGALDGVKEALRPQGNDKGRQTWLGSCWSKTTPRCRGESLPFSKPPATPPTAPRMV